MPVAVFEFAASTKHKIFTRGFKWFCKDCENRGSVVEKLKAYTGDLQKEVVKLADVSKSLKSSESTIKETSHKIEASADITSRSWADIARDVPNNPQPEALVQSIGAEVAVQQANIGRDQESREKNIIIFNVSEVADPTDDAPRPVTDDDFFKDVCENGLELSLPKVSKIVRIGKEKSEGKKRPIHVKFEREFDKRKFLSTLYKLKGSKFDHIHVSHDMNESERLVSKRLLREAYKRNQDEAPKNFAYKVRGPPWNLRIVKKYQQANNQPANQHVDLTHGEDQEETT